MRKDLGRGSGGAGRPGWKGRAGHRRGSGPLTGGPPGQVLAAGAAGLRASGGAGSSQCRQRTAQSPPPWASPRILAERAAAGPGLRLPRQTRLPVGPWWLAALQRQGSLPFWTERDVGRGRVRAGRQPEVQAEPEGRGRARGRGRGWDTCVDGGGRGVAPGALRRCGGGGRFPRPGRGASRTHRRRRSEAEDTALRARGSGPALLSRSCGPK